MRSFFFGQSIGLASLIPGGLGSSDAITGILPNMARNEIVLRAQFQLLF